MANELSERRLLANARLAELNRKHGGIATVFQVKERKEELDEYCDLMTDVYGTRVAQSADLMRSVIAQLCAAANASTTDALRQSHETARILLRDLETNLETALEKDERQELVVVRKLKLCVGHAELRSGTVETSFHRASH